MKNPEKYPQLGFTNGLIEKNARKRLAQSKAQKKENVPNVMKQKKELCQKPASISGQAGKRMDICVRMENIPDIARNVIRSKTKSGKETESIFIHHGR